MSDLEDLNYITHPHTSGGRMPTDKGYRYFVNELMDIEHLKSGEKAKIKKQIDELDLASDEIYKEISKILGRLTKEISIVSQPNFSKAILEKLELVNISSNKVLVVVSIKSGFVRTLIFDVHSEISRDKLEKISRILNERLSGLTLKEIKKTYKDRIGELQSEHTGIVKVFVDSIDKIFHDETDGMTLYVGGTLEILSQPEFGSTQNYKNLIELTDDKDVVIHVLNSIPTDENGVAISIGEESKDDKMKDYSIISTTYSIGDMSGKIALIGPKRMNYSKLVSWLNFTTDLIKEKL